MKIQSSILIIFCASLTMVGCSSAPPSNVDNICTIFRDKDDWHEEAVDVFDKWGVPVHVQMAIIHQESKFRSEAKPERTKLLWVIPWSRPSTAYGYAQVLDQTWEWYKDKTGNSWADRNEFDDAIDFVGWYGDLSHKTLGISKWDAEKQYLAYHEGHGGYKRKSYKKKPWLEKVAAKVGRRANKYRAQYAKCKHNLDSGWSFWPFG